MKHRKILAFLTAVITVVVMLVLGEVLVRVFSPTEYLYPRYQFSPEYGMLPFADVKMEHAVPGRFKFTYSTNADHCRGDRVTPDDALPTAVILGDSYSFGMGVDDGEEYPAVMRGALADRCQVLNLGSPGWGLTQEIRRFYDFGMAYEPDLVILQFCANDPDDNFANRVTRVTDNGFEFKNSDYSINALKKVLSRSVIQKSQLYNYFRAIASRAAQTWFVNRRQAQSVSETGAEKRPDPGAVPPREAVYIELLDAFATDLDHRGIPLVMISVDEQLSRFPHIEETVHRLDQEGKLTYLEVLDWLSGAGEYRSPEGHVWGPRAHAVIGRELGAYADRSVLSRISN